jgi:hypothetical protein
VQIRAGDGLKRLGVSNSQEVVPADVRGNRDNSREIEVDWQWEKFVELQQVGVGL